MAEIEFYYDFGSPNAYLAHKLLPGISERAGAKLVYRPILIGGIFKATNNQPPLAAFRDVKGKNAYLRVELARFVERHGIDFVWNPHFPVNTLAVMRGAIYAEGKAWEQRYIDTVFDAMWRYGKKMDDPEVIATVLQAADLPVEDIMAATQTAEIKGRLAEATETAVARGAFGSPTMFVGAEMFFGKDSLADLEWRLGH